MKHKMEGKERNSEIYIGVVLIAVFLLSLIPILWCSFFNYATGDDLWEGAVAYQAIKNGKSFPELMKEVFAWMKVDYLGWQGNWSSTFLWCFSPNVFGEKAYIVTVWIGLLSLCLGNWYFLQHFNKKYLCFGKSTLVIFWTVFTFLSIQYMPYIRGGLFWYSAMINYTFPYGLTLAAFVWIDRFMEEKKGKYLLWLSLFYAFLGGSGYLCIVLNFEILCLYYLFLLWKKDWSRLRQAVKLLLPLALLLIGFVISLLSPGNAVRGGEAYELGGSRVLSTLLQCFKEGALAIPKNLWEIKLLAVLLPFLLLLFWKNLNLEKCKLQFSYPLEITVLIYLLTCSVYAPGIYSQSDLSGGVYDTIFWVFLLGFYLILIYWTGYFKVKYQEKKERRSSLETVDGKDSWERKGRISRELLVFTATVLLCVVGNRFLFHNTAFRVSYDYIATGQLLDFEMQMRERLTILNNPMVEDAVVPEMNDWQGPIMHMPLTQDPTAYINHATARFYGKKSVVAIPRDEYYRLYIEQH